MGFFSWLTGSSNSKSAAAQTDIPSTMVGNDSTRPNIPPGQKKELFTRTVTPAAVQANRNEQRRAERNARRDLLFQVVRESMIRVGILSSAFRFKVLALDQRGRVFLVMIDLSSEFASETGKLAEIEALISQSAKARFDVVVQAVYWRFTETVSSGTTRKGAVSAPAPLSGAPISGPAPLSGRPMGTPKSAAISMRVAPNSVPARNRSDPIDQTEVDAFKRALVAGTQPQITGAAASPVARSGSLAAMATAAKAAVSAATHNKLLLTGYEDTEMHDPDEPAPALSATQYGDLR